MSRGLAIGQLIALFTIFHGMKGGKNEGQEKEVVVGGL